MDNFMDKLAKRFNAGEIIRANAQAEARDMKRMQERTAEYERMMQEMRRLNLKNVEMTEQVQQLIQCGIEQFEGYGNDTAEIINAVGSTKEDVLSIKNSVADASVKSDDGFVRMDRKLDDVERVVGDNLRQNQQAVSDALRELEARLEEQLKADNNMDMAFERIETAISTSRYATEGTIREMSELVKQMQTSVAQMEETIRNTREILIATRMSVEEGNKHLEEHIHKENVRVYRNVQAVVVEEATKRARDMGVRMDQVEANMKKTNGLKPLVAITLLAALASVALQVLQILQIL